MCNFLGPGHRLDAVRVSIEEGCEWRGERERGEDHIYQERGRELMGGGMCCASWENRWGGACSWGLEGEAVGLRENPIYLIH
jgi:hypothetical protein